MSQHVCPLYSMYSSCLPIVPYLAWLWTRVCVCVWVCIKAEINWLCVGLPNALFTFVYACHRFDCRLSIPSLSHSLSPVSFFLFSCPLHATQLSGNIFVHIFLCVWYNFLAWCVPHFLIMHTHVFEIYSAQTSIRLKAVEVDKDFPFFHDAA